MSRRRYAGLILVLLAGGASGARAQGDYREALKLEAVGATGLPAGWSGGPPGTVVVDSATVHSAPYAVRIQRDSASPGQASMLALTVPVTFSGTSLKLAGWLRAEKLDGSAGLWLQEDGRGGPVQSDYPYQHPAAAPTAEWQRFTITLPLDPRARTLHLGAQLVGKGTLWMDDLELLVDGRPPWEAPARVVVALGGETDREFERGSRVVARKLTRRQIENLVVLGKVWGFVKYHHPRVAAGELNWDYELFRVLPAVLAARDARTRNSALSRWLARVGEPPKCSPCASPPPADLQMPAPIGWIHDRSTLGAELSWRLEGIHANRFAGSAQYYAGITPGARQPDFSNEDSYRDKPYPDAGYRLLALYRFWNIIQYWFPYRYALGEDWTGVLRRFVPQVLAARDRDQYRRVLLRLTARVRDTHANLWGELRLRPPVGSASLPVIVRPVEGRMVVSGYLDDAAGPATGLHPGDAIERLDGVSVDALIARWRPYYAASNEAVVLRDVAAALTRGKPGPVRLTVRRQGRTLQLTAVRASSQPDGRGETHDLPGASFRMLTDDVAYLKLPYVTAAQVTEYLGKAAAAKVLVIDLRNYPEFVLYALGGHLVDRMTPFARVTRALQHNPGAFAWSDPLSLLPVAPLFAGKVAILVDETSQSRAEFTAMALRTAPGAIVVGSTTAGADGDVSRIPLPGGVQGLISGNGIFYPDRRPTQRIGILPDVVVCPTIAGIREGRDEVLEAAVSHALGRSFRMPTVTE